MTKGKLIFLHLPKTGGTTLRTILDQQFGASATCGIYDGDPGFISYEAFSKLSVERRSAYRAYSGHFMFGLHQLINTDAFYYAIFRDPVERIISYYHHAMSHAPVFQKNPVSLLKFLNRSDWQVDNLYTRFISGQRAEFGKCSSHMLIQAMENIDRYFITVGLQDQFDQSIQLLSTKLGWLTVEYASSNIGHGRPSQEYFSHQEIDRVRNMNQLDRILYDFVKKRFYEEKAKMGQSSKRRSQPKHLISI